MLDNDEEFGYGVLIEEGYQGEINYIKQGSLIG
jgi:hypothetical protein